MMLRSPVWLGVGVACALGLFALLWSWRRILASRPPGVITSLPAHAACVAMPFVLAPFEPGAWALVRIAFSVAAVTMTTKVWTVARARPRDGGDVRPLRAVVHHAAGDDMAYG